MIDLREGKKIFAVAYQFAKGVYSNQNGGQLGLVYILAETEGEAKKLFDAGGIIAVSEISLEDYLKSGRAT